MAADEDQAYYIRSRGRTAGPYTVAKLRVLRSRGRFSRTHQVSTDGLNWEPASAVEELFAPNAVGVVATTTTPPNDSRIPDQGWYYHSAGQQHGPVDSIALQAMARNAQLRPTDLVWREGMPEWVELRSTDEFGGHLARPASILPPAGYAANYCFACGGQLDARAELCPRCGVRQKPSRPPKSRTTACLFAWFLGGLGAHHFYLGHPALGVVYLLFCWTLIPSTIAFVEGIFFLAMTDEAFAAKYNG